MLKMKCAPCTLINHGILFIRHYKFKMFGKINTQSAIFCFSQRTLTHRFLFTIKSKQPLQHQDVANLGSSSTFLKYVSFAKLVVLSYRM